MACVVVDAEIPPLLLLGLLALLERCWGGVAAELEPLEAEVAGWFCCWDVGYYWVGLLLPADN